MSSTSMMSPMVVKTGVAAVAGAALDRFICNEQNAMQNVYFGVSVGAGIGLGSYLASVIPDTNLIADDPSGMWKGKSVISRVLEVGSGTASAFIISKYMIKNNMNTPITTRLLCVVASDILAEVVSDYVFQQPIAYLA